MVEVHRLQETPHSPTPQSRQMMKAATAATAGGSFLVMSGLMLTGTIIALAVATPFLLIFSPVVVPAVVTVLLLATGFLAAGGFVLAAVAVLSWMYKYAKQGGAESMDKNKARAMAKAASK